MPIALTELVAETDRYLNASKIADYCPNGLQVEGRVQVRRIVSGVTASQALLDAAVEQGADVVLVHHGYFWKNEDPRVVGMKGRRLKTLLVHDISLLAYHLPLDVHPEVGNNVQLAQLLGLQVDGLLEPDDPKSVGLVGSLPANMMPAEFAEHLQRTLGRQPLTIEGDRPIRRVAWCTGGAQGYIEKAVAIGADAYLTGEASEPTVHVARETGLSFYAAGHHATERYGVHALGEWMAERFGIEHRFVDIDNPV
ncbi:Nif3-like dinuclear metal center hexameric protein [Stutzerimonas tarimensis]|uniref:Nif3-like dinuclear metal center hexameric protein n=1 Tax=Stutzerimonas tarimensis TaxID=1507735 RepID=A0ABV7T3W3_9GAMM